MLLQTDNLLTLHKNLLAQASRNIVSVSNAAITGQRHVLKLAESQLAFKPALYLREKSTDLKNRTDWFVMSVENYLSNQNRAIESLGQKVILLDPAQVLKRGYSITYFNGKPLTDNTDLNKGDTIRTQLFNGTIYSEIKSKQEYYGEEDQLHGSNPGA